MNNQELAIEIYKRLLEVGINASMASVPVIEEVLNEERERRLAKRSSDASAFSDKKSAASKLTQN